MGCPLPNSLPRIPHLLDEKTVEVCGTSEPKAGFTATVGPPPVPGKGQCWRPEGRMFLVRLLAKMLRYAETIVNLPISEQQHTQYLSHCALSWHYLMTRYRDANWMLSVPDIGSKFDAVLP